MPRGVPSGEDWLRVTRNLKNLKEVSLIFFVTKILYVFENCFVAHNLKPLKIYLIFKI